MFTGIVEKIVKVVDVRETPMYRRLVMATEWADVVPGQSIAINGVCLTASDVPGGGRVGFDVIAETLAKTNLGLLKAGDWVNVERSLKIGDRIDGHFVQGHVNGVAKLVNEIRSESEVRLVVQPPKDLAKYVVPKGSVAIDGVSLTVAAISGHNFEVALIPTTLKLTTLGDRPAGWPFNLETDILSKTIISWLEQRE